MDAGFPKAVRALLDGEALDGESLAELKGGIMRFAGRHASDLESEELVSGILLKLISGRAAMEIGAGNERAYVSTMVRNLANDIRRRSRREAEIIERLETAEVIEAEQEAVVDEAAMVSIEQSWRAETVERTRAMYREGRAEAVDQVFRLARGEVTMRQLIAAEREQSRTFTTSHNRLTKRHQRAREALLDTANAMESEGKLTPGEAERLRYRVRWLLRCQPSASRGVSRGEDG